MPTGIYIRTKEQKENIGKGLKKAYYEGRRKPIVVSEENKLKLSKRLKENPVMKIPGVAEKQGKSMKNIWKKLKKEGKTLFPKNFVMHNKDKHLEEEYGFKKAKEIKDKIKEKRLYQKFITKDTKIEVKFQNELQNRGIKFQKHKPITNIENKYQCDLLIEPNIVIECDGNYWHKYPNHSEKDITRTNEMREKGYMVFRYWETEINSNTEGCIDEIEEYLVQINNTKVYE